MQAVVLFLPIRLSLLSCLHLAHLPRAVSPMLQVSLLLVYRMH